MTSRRPVDGRTQCADGDYRPWIVFPPKASGKGVRQGRPPLLLGWHQNVSSIAVQ